MKIMPFFLFMLAVFCVFLVPSYFFLFSPISSVHDVLIWSTIDMLRGNHLWHAENDFNHRTRPIYPPP